MMMSSNHPFHMVDQSPWPFTSSMGMMLMMLGMIQWFHYYNNMLMIMGFMIILLTILQWWRDVVRESSLQGLHTLNVMINLQWGMILFIISEIFFFISFFWASFYSNLSPSIELGMNWPPKGIYTFIPFNIPLLNSIILLSSGITITWSHHALLNNNYYQSLYSLFYTIMLGIYFTILQNYEYMDSSFSISDSIYGSTFFMSTGFHGIHVLIGTMFLIICLLRHLNNNFSMNHHFSYEAATWYWHFVDVIWLFLFITIYWWNS